MKYIPVALLLFLLLWTPSLGATSLWGTELGNLYQDDVANAVGDLITVLVVEKTQASHEADTRTSQDLGIKVDPGVFLTDIFAGLQPSYGDSASGGGQITRTGSVLAEITVVIKEVLPGGVFRVEGSKGIIVDGERATITLEGLIRSGDIERDNTIKSYKLAELNMDYSGQGVIAAKQRPSFIEWILNWIF